MTNELYSGDAGLDYLIRGMSGGQIIVFTSNSQRLLDKVLLNLSQKISSGGDRVCFLDMKKSIDSNLLKGMGIGIDEHFEFHRPNSPAPFDWGNLVQDYEMVICNSHSDDSLKSTIKFKKAKEIVWIIGALSRLKTPLKYVANVIIHCSSTINGPEKVQFELVKHRLEKPLCETIITDFL
jgi:hypothetical protein